VRPAAEESGAADAQIAYPLDQVRIAVALGDLAEYAPAARGVDCILHEVLLKRYAGHPGTLARAGGKSRRADDLAEIGAFPSAVDGLDAVIAPQSGDGRSQTGVAIECHPVVEQVGKQRPVR